MMMIDPDPFKEFLSSLSRITLLNFQLWDGKGLVFASGPDPAEEPNLRAHRDFSAEVMRHAAYKCTQCESRYLMFGIPIKYGQEAIGSLIAYRLNSDREWESGDIPSEKTSHAKEMEAFLSHLARLMEDTWVGRKEAQEMAEELAQNFEDLALYSRISTQIKTLKFSDQMLKVLMEEVLETMRVDLAFLRMPDRQEYNTLVSTDELSDRIRDQSSFVNELINAMPQEGLFPEEDYFIVNDSSITPGYMELHPDPYRFLAVNITYNGRFEGWMGLVSFNPREIFRQSELKLLRSITRQISVLMANVDLYHDLERFVINVVKSLVYTIEAKDVYTKGHSERVNRYSMLMAEQLNLDEKQKDALNWASILHDIGKIGIPEKILNKPGRLSDEEYEIIKGHPKKGSNILEPLAEQLSSSLPSILHHHERYDGQGYPHGLKGEEIPFLARIIAVADTFDAINSDRAYRSARPPEEALAMMEQMGGSQLDPDLVQVFKQVFKAVINPEHESKLGE